MQNPNLVMFYDPQSLTRAYFERKDPQRLDQVVGTIRQQWCEITGAPIYKARFTMYNEVVVRKYPCSKAGLTKAIEFIGERYESGPPSQNSIPGTLQGKGRAD